MKKAAVGFLILLSAVLSGCSNDVQHKHVKKPSYGDKLIAETMDVPEHYTFQNESESGISKVLVDADIIVPEVYGVDVIEAIPGVFSEEQVHKFIKQHTDHFEWYDFFDETPYSGEGFKKHAFDEHLDIYGIYLENAEEIERDKDNGRYRELMVEYGLHSKTGAIGFTPTLEYTNSNRDPGISQLVSLNEQNMANDCTISLEKAIKFADAEAELISPDFALSQYGQLDPKMGKGHVNSPEYYGLKYTRNINGIPVNPDDMYKDVGDGSDYTSDTECVGMTVNDDGVCWIYYTNPTQPGEVVEENVELLPFQDIIDIFEKVSMLSIKHLEIYDNLESNIMDIREIRFGYMAVKQPESIGGYRYIPVWDFYGLSYPLYKDCPFYPENYDEAVFTINAIDGTVIDRSMGY